MLALVGLCHMYAYYASNCDKLIQFLASLTAPTLGVYSPVLKLCITEHFGTLTLQLPSQQVSKLHITRNSLVPLNCECHGYSSIEYASRKKYCRPNMKPLFRQHPHVVRVFEASVASSESGFVDLYGILFVQR